MITVGLNRDNSDSESDDDTTKKRKNVEVDVNRDTKKKQRYDQLTFNSTFPFITMETVSSFCTEGMIHLLLN